MIKPIQQCGHAGQCGEGRTFSRGDGFFFQPQGEGCSASAGGNDRPEHPPPARREVKIVPQPAGFWIAAHGNLHYSDRRQKADTVEQATLVLARNSVGLRCNPSPSGCDRRATLCPVHRRSVLESYELCNPIISKLPVAANDMYPAFL